MIDRTIPFYNIIMRCDRILPMEIKLPDGYSIRTYQPGDEDAWAALMCAAGEQTALDEAKALFTERYLADASLTDRIFFAIAPNGEIVGSAIAWEHDPRGMGVRALHWVAVQPEHQRCGLGKALCQTCMRLFRREDNALPVYLHTQPWSWKAVLLYGSMGFRIQRSDTFARYENQYPLAMAALQNVLTAKQLAAVESRIDP